ncbi:MAG: chloride channel protein [Sedimentisphaerales bacterium]|jgi:CIC family chloride channel protein|nr:chloride channel protein [Sedimentisphaerales bacterium]HNY79124.1 chloride channel protein [Sedimentisphaerales bacterium]HOC64166.1 chloride channel protein [Sedimentisphaerales bacterium]HOH65032.1 chloride channel protein [Sedimentisphaerales bacterium]HQA90059.1 chloride channel protein [Sedimentisphaerales bacterium]
MQTIWNTRPSIFRRLKLTPATEMLLLAVFVGILGGFGALAFKKLIILFQVVFWSQPDMSPEALFAVAWYRRLLLPAVGGGIAGLLIYFLAREVRGDGVAEVMAAVLTHNSVIRPIVVVVKSLTSAIGIASGGSLGREGPIVQIGAAIASCVGQVFRLPAVQLKTLVGCGVAAGIAATFNAPMAGTLFAMELIVADFGLSAFTPILVSAVAATAVTRQFRGDITEFTLPLFTMVSPWEFGLYLVLGLVAGVVGFVFSRSVYMAGDLFEKTRIPLWIRPACGGLLVGVIAILYPHIMGVGYESIQVLFEGQLTSGLVFGLVALKIVATSISIGSGGSGGVFAPSLFIGAMLGGAFGHAVHQWFPQVTASPVAYALVGMAAVNGACTLAPLSAIVILAEMTNEYAMLLPLMLTVVMASFVARKLSAESIYTEKLRRQGIQAHHGEDLNVLRTIPVKAVLRNDEASVSEKAPFEALVRLALEMHRYVIFTLGDRGRLTGVISLADLKHILSDPDELRHAYDIVDFKESIVPVRVNQSLDAVVDRFAETGLDRLPVVDEEGRLVGSVVHSDVLRRYNQEVAHRNIAVELGARIAAHDQSQTLHIGGDTIVTEIEVPRWMAGRKLGELQLRSRYRVSVFIVRELQEGRPARFVTPNADYAFGAGDRILVSGTHKDIQALQNNL